MTPELEDPIAEPFRIEVVETDDISRLDLFGELDLATAPKLRERLDEIESKEPAVIAVNFQGLSFMDSSGLREILRVHERRRDSGGRFAVVGGSEPVDRLLEMTGLDKVLDLVASPDELSSGS